MRQVRIQGDGSVHGTRVFDEAGVEIATTYVEFTHRAQDIPGAVIETLAPKIDVTISAVERTRCPYCGHVQEVDDDA